MREQLISYFSAEKQESLVFLGAGLAAIALSAWLLRTGSAFRGAAVPLVLVGLIQLTVGGAVFLRTDAQIAALLARLEAAPATLAHDEVPRMETVMRNFSVYKIIELAIFALGVALTYAGRDRATLYAAGIGCVAQGAVMLLCDLFAEHRGAAYLALLRQL